MRDEARAFFQDTLVAAEPLVTSVEVLQEMMHAYLPVGRFATLDAALALARARMASIWRVELEDVELARALAEAEGGIGARDLIHLASSRRRGVRAIKTFDRALAAASDRI